jgi:hypothetical protein
MQQSTMKKLSPVIMVDAIESCVPFWERLGFTKTAEVPEGDRLGFVILAKDTVEVMYQTHESVRRTPPRARAACERARSRVLRRGERERQARSRDGGRGAARRRSTGMDDRRGAGRARRMFAQPTGD